VRSCTRHHSWRRGRRGTSSCPRRRRRAFPSSPP
jgi:hypothetical protein